MTHAFIDAATAVECYGIDVGGTKEVMNYSVTVLNPFDRFVETKHRSTVKRYAIAEFLWYMRGSNRLEEIAHYAPFWRTISDDGETVNSAYGHRLMYQFGVDQWGETLLTLLQSEDTRQATMYISSPTDVGVATKDFPCTYGLQFMIRNGLLHLTCLMRSNDLITGFCNDAPVFMMMQELMLEKIRASTVPEYELELGTYTHFAVSMHRYDKHAKKVAKVVRDAKEYGKDTEVMPFMTRHTVTELHKLQQNERLLRMADNTEEITREPHELHDPWCQRAYEILRGDK